MPDRNPTPQFEDEVRLAAAAPEAAPEFVRNLHAQLLERASLLPGAPARRRQPRLVWAMALVLALALISILLIGPQQVATAMQTLIGYLPGVGIIDQSAPVQIIAEPAKSSKNGITVTVKQVMADSTRTFVVYQVSGIPAPQVGSASPVCTEAPGLKLPDGKALTSTGRRGFGMESTSGSPISFETSVTFPPVPPEVHALIFLPPCQMPPIELALVPAPAGFATPGAEIERVIATAAPERSGDLSSAPPAVTTPSVTGAATLPATPTAVPDGSGLYLDRVIELEDSYLFIGNFTDAGDLPGILVDSGDFAYKVHFMDRNGNPVPSKQRPDIQPEIRWASVYYWAYEIPKTVDGPVQIRLDSVDIETTHTAHFQVDAGPEPQIDQEWSLDLPLELGGHQFVIDRVKMLANGYRLFWHSVSDVPDGIDVSVSMRDVPASTTESPMRRETRAEGKVNYLQDFLVEGEVPTGVLTFELTLYLIEAFPGPWSLSWSPH